ncbi:M56 family metallopeptidase [Saccharopolyspora indica]|uniref:M56 family metallopeptidase n=1 Tax=Saccharopolyspora indica TaxID=1229659 RepID=UPI0022EB65A8|nr:M56 family metallopeptidase [Saccharopolyspora indica]MDA3644092.1 M56 family metallopeptidase [Saccharopolyspora indica]
MTLAACLALNGALGAVVAPRLLRRLTVSETAPRLGIAVWALAVAGVLSSWVAAAAVAVLSATDWSGRIADFVHSCLTALGSLGGQHPLAASSAAALAVLWLGWSLWRAGRHWVRAHRRGVRHARALRLVGCAAPGFGPGVVVVETADVAAYCVAGPLRTVAITRGALDALTPAELNAVLAHEHAHLAGRHHLLLTVLGAIRRAFPGVRLFRAAEREVGRLLEMCADDVAVRRQGAGPLLSALASMTGGPVPSGSLGAAGHSVLSRAVRLADPPPRSRRVVHRAALGGTAATLVAGPGVSLLVMGLAVCSVLYL